MSRSQINCDRVSNMAILAAIAGAFLFEIYPNSQAFWMAVAVAAGVTALVSYVIRYSGEDSDSLNKAVLVETGVSAETHRKLTFDDGKEDLVSRSIAIRYPLEFHKDVVYRMGGVREPRSKSASDLYAIYDDLITQRKGTARTKRLHHLLGTTAHIAARSTDLDADLLYVEEVFSGFRSTQDQAWIDSFKIISTEHETVN